MKKLENMDYRLDLYNAIENYGNNMDEEHDSIFVLTHNSKQSDGFSALNGNLDSLMYMISVENYVNLQTDDDKQKLIDTQKFILNTAFNILANDKTKRDHFTTHLLDFNKDATHI